MYGKHNEYSMLIFPICGMYNLNRRQMTACFGSDIVIR